MCNQVRLKLACSVADTSDILEFWDLARIDIIQARQQTTKVLIRLLGCAGWSAPLLFAYDVRQVFSWRSSYVLAWKSFRKGGLCYFFWHVFVIKFDFQISLYFVGTKEERGITAWHIPSGLVRNSSRYSDSREPYNPWMPEEFRKSKILKFIPFLPGPEIKRKHIYDDINTEHFETEHLWQRHWR